MNTIKLNTIGEIKSSAGGGKLSKQWTGHADVDGLRAIGWTDDDIAYYQANGVNWNEEYDKFHKVPDYNKFIFPYLTASNISTYKNDIVYLPKIDTSNVTSMNKMFDSCVYLVAIPQIDTSKVTDMSEMFISCNALNSIPKLNTNKVTNMSGMFRYCETLVAIPQFNTLNVTNMSNMFERCTSLTTIPQLNTSNVQNMSSMFRECNSLRNVPQFDTSKVINISTMFYCCRTFSGFQFDMSNIENIYSAFYCCNSLIYANIKNIKTNIDLKSARLLSKESLLYIINNESATSAIIIHLHTNAYGEYNYDKDVINALKNHPNVSISN